MSTSATSGQGGRWSDVGAVPEDVEEWVAACSKLLRRIFEPAAPHEPSDRGNLPALSDDGVPALQVLTEVEEHVVAGSVFQRHPMSIAHMHPAPATISVVADLLVAALNQCAFIREEAPAATVLEQRVVDWLARRVGYGHGAGGVLTSGGTMSNLLAVRLAMSRRDAVGGARPGSVIASSAAHLSLEKAAAVAGLDRASIIRLPCDEEGRVRLADLGGVVDRARAAGRPPFLIAATAGTTSTGAVEDVSAVLRVARDADAWLHIDAAHGGSLCLTGDRRARCWREADSISWDPHKTLYVSYASGCLLVKRRACLSTFEANGDYALKRGATEDAGTWHFEGSRRMDALKLWMCIRHFGVEGYRRLSLETMEIAREFASHITHADDMELVTWPETNIVCFRVVPDGFEDAALDDLQDDVQRTLFRDGGPLLSTTRVGDRTVLRAVISNPQSGTLRWERVLKRVRSAAHTAGPSRPTRLDGPVGPELRRLR